MRSFDPLKYNAAAVVGCVVLALAGCGGGSAAPAVDTQTVAPASPAQFDLSRWKLQLPVDRFGGTGGSGGIEFEAQTVLTARPLADYSDAYFHLDARGRLVFTAPANGAVTSPGVGSDHTRSELREAYTGPGADADGNWRGSGTLTGTCAVQSVATASNVAVIAQLRGLSNTLAMLVYRPATHEAAIDIYSANASGSTHELTVLAQHVNLGDEIRYSLSFSGSLLVVTVNGTTLSRAVDSSWAGAPLYFKLGAYHLAPNVGNAPGDATAVAYSAFAVSH